MSIGIYKWGWGDGGANVAFWGWIGNDPVVFSGNAFVPSIVKNSNVPSIVTDSSRLKIVI